MNAIVYSSSDEYSYLAGISLKSCLEHNPNLQDTEIFILDNGISEKNKEKIRQICVEYSYKLSFIDVVAEIGKLNKTGLITEHKSDVGVSYATYGRLFVDQVMPERIQRVIFLDCDTLIMGNIESLFKLNMGEKVLGLVCDICRLEYRKVIEMPLNQKYYNAGVMVIDLKKWRENRCTERIFNRIQEGKGCFPLVDQDLINTVCRNEIFTLDPRFNYLSQTFLYDYSGLCKVYNVNDDNYYTKKVFETAKINPIIYHFSGSTLCRPWYKNSRHPMKKVYDSYYYNSPWKDRPQVSYKLPLQYKIQEYLYRQPIKGMAVFCGKVMQRLFIKITYNF